MQEVVADIRQPGGAARRGGQAELGEAVGQADALGRGLGVAAGAGDDLPWEFLAALPAAVFPYYAELPAAALGRVKVGDHFLWFAPS